MYNERKRFGSYNLKGDVFIMTNLELYSLVREELIRIFKNNNIENPERYLELTDLSASSILKNIYGLKLDIEEGLPFTFAQIIIHSVPPKLRDSIDFNNKELILELFKEFKPDLFLAHARSLKQAELCECFMTKLGISPKLKSALNGYILAIRNLSDYLLLEKTRENVIKDLLKKYNPLSLGPVTSYLASKAGMGTGFTARIAEGVLMDLDPSFSDIIPFSDYLKDTFKVFLNKEFKNRKEFTEFIINLCKEVNSEEHNFILTPYLVNRLIYLCYTGDLFLDNVKVDCKDEFLLKAK